MCMEHYPFNCTCGALIACLCGAIDHIAYAHEPMKPKLGDRLNMELLKKAYWYWYDEEKLMVLSPEEVLGIG